jgi:hypothetical protein
MRILKALSAVVLSAGLLALFGCDKDKPTQPVPPKDYVVYFADVAPQFTYFGYNTSSGQVDSFTLPYSSRRSGLGISPDGKTMYLNPEGYIVEISLDSHVVIAEHATTANGRETVISPDGQYIAILNKYLYILKIPEFNLIYYDTGYSFNGVFSYDSKSLYCSTFDDQGKLYANIINLSDSITVSRKYFSDGGAWMILPDRDETTWFVFLWLGWETFLFQVYDEPRDSIVYSQLLNPGFGDMEITPDGKYLIFSQRGTLRGLCPPPLYFTIFNIANNEILKEVNTTAIADGVNPFFTGDICITPDGKRLIGTYALGGGKFFDFNIESMEFERYVFLGNDKALYYLTCQSSP